MSQLKLPHLMILASVLAAPLALAQQAAPAAKPVVAATKAPSFKAHLLNRAEIDKLLAHPESVVVIDVRRPDELSSIGGFPVYLSIQVDDLEKSLAYIPKDRSIITVSNHAGRAGKVADILAAKGFKIAGAAGVQLYEQEGGKLSKIAIPPKKS